MSDWLRILLFSLVVALGGTTLMAHGLFIVDHGRLPDGAGEVWNWLLGLGG